MNIYGVRRYGLLLIVFVFGLVLGSLSSKLIAILSIPLLLVWVINWDEASYKRNLIKIKKSSSAGTLED